MTSFETESTNSVVSVNALIRFTAKQCCILCCQQKCCILGYLAFLQQLLLCQMQHVASKRGNSQCPLHMSSQRGSEPWAQLQGSLTPQKCVTSVPLLWSSEISTNRENALKLCLCHARDCFLACVTLLLPRLCHARDAPFLVSK